MQKIRGIKGYKSMSEDRVLSALNGSESAKKNTERIWIARNQQKMKIMMLIKHLKK